MNCDFSDKAETTEELLQAAACAPELMPMVKAAIRDEYTGPGSGDKEAPPRHSSWWGVDVNGSAAAIRCYGAPP